MATGGFFYSHHFQVSQIGEVDPIVKPGIHHDDAGHSHLHVFAGRYLVTPDTVASDLLDAPSTGVEKEGGTYWVPMMYWNGQAVLPNDISARYGLAGKNPADIVAFPPGFGVVAGRTKQTINWNVSPIMRPGVQSWDTPPSPSPDRNLEASIEFPDLWDGNTPDGPDWTAHTAYSKANVVPPGWKALPSLKIIIKYPKGLPPKETCELSSGPPSSLHGDFLNTWDQERLEIVLDHCVRGRRNCGEVGRGDPA